MISPEEILGFPARPPSEVEWEDLLVRLEIAPRALRLAVEDARADDDPEVEQILAFAAGMEVMLQYLLDRMSRDEEVPEDFAFELDAREGHLHLLERHRRRSFAMVQRRGIDVWDWRLRGGPFPGATTYQLLQGAVLLDGRVLSAVRNPEPAG